MKIKFVGTGYAAFSVDKTYRYSLVRDWRDSMLYQATCAPDQGKLAFIMLNPSTADAEFNDPTIHRCQRRAMTLGFSSMEIVNIFAYRSTDPAGILRADDPIGPLNDEHILMAVRAAQMTICAWGSQRWPLVHARQSGVLKLLGSLPLHILHMNGDGTPGHPLYLPYNKQPYLWHKVAQRG